MPIIVNRRTGDIISMSEITQQQKNKAWKHILEYWIKRNDDKFVAMIKEKETTQEKDS